MRTFNYIIVINGVIIFQEADKKVDYIPNRSVTLPFTPTAYHSVSPGDRTGNPYTRKMVNIIFRVRPDLHELER